jgi:seryl-tRNA synthetase
MATSSATVLSVPPDNTKETVDFLRRLATMLSGGKNAATLLDAALLIEALLRRATAAEQRHQEQQDDHARTVELLEAAELAAEKLTTEIASLNARLAESERQAEGARRSSFEDARRLQDALEDAEIQLAQANAELDALREPVNPMEPLEPITAIDPSIAIVPVASLQLARTQFDFLAAGFARSGDVISQTICEIGACAIDKALSGNEPAARD